MGLEHDHGRVNSRPKGERDYSLFSGLPDGVPGASPEKHSLDRHHDRDVNGKGR